MQTPIDYFDMDVLYIVGDGSLHNNIELMYSIRSLAANAQHLGQIYICSEHFPGFLDPHCKRLTWIKYKQPGKSAAVNVLCAMSYALHNSSIGDQFMLCNDDFFYIRPTDFDCIPYYTKGQLPAQASESIGSKVYCKTLIDTRDLLIRYGFPTTSFAHHCCTHWDKSLFFWAESEGIWRDAARLPFGVSMVSVMANIILYVSAIVAGRYNKANGTYDDWLTSVVKMRKDVKVRHFADREDLLRQIGDNDCFSIYDSAIDDGVLDYLHDLFPKKSIYER